MGEWGPGLVPIELCLESLVHTDPGRASHLGRLWHMSQELPSFMTKPDGQTMK